MTKKIFRSILLVAGAVLLSSFILIMGCLYDYFLRIQETQIKDELQLAAAAVEQNGTDYLKTLSSSRYRLTWIRPDGSVIYDTQTDSDSLENHSDREEVQAALTNGEGESSRYSSTLLEKTLYYARRLEDGSVLRISVSRATVGILALGMLQPVLVILIVALVLSAVLANRVSKRIIQPLNDLDLEHPLENTSYEELSPLLGRLNRQRSQIAMQMHELQRKTDEFDQITGNLQEGLVLLDNKGLVISMNPAAQKIFHADAACIGDDFLTVDRSHDISRIIQNAFSDGHCDGRLDRDGRIYQLDVSRIDSSGQPIGAAILAIDMTERETAEQTRREFTANVSHELKTPLQGIIGSAELIENGLVKPEDMPRFIGHIRTEAQRLIQLIRDIIRLSQLDEGADLPFEDLDLLTVAQEAAEDLTDAAAARKITVTVEGDDVFLSGVRRLLYEVIYNLCDNAIKYNRENGQVDIRVAALEAGASVTVSDTGIGIAPEHQERIFERFYRIDKSHSKASGGTGLGLSIVKHAVQYHHGQIHLDSTPGEGTSICITLPFNR